MAWPCFWVVDSDDALAGLRRHSRQVAGGPMTCEGGYHSAIGPTWREPANRNAEGYMDGGGAVEAYVGDERWPPACVCGYVFVEDDHWQVWREAIYRERDGVHDWPMRDLPVGAVFDAFWYPTDWKGADGRAISVVLPNPQTGGSDHAWNVDGPANSDGKLTPHAWTRHGDPDDLPTFSVTPSILTAVYHGFLTLGVLVDPV